MGRRPALVGFWVAVSVGLGVAAAAEPKPTRPPPESREADTLKERLSDKASDEQRVDNCQVPADKRGSKERPGCPAPVPLGERRK
jgi:hypothetical protein